MKKVSHFQARSARYTCLECGKQTRETGDGESSVQMCADCYEWAGLENSHSDRSHDGQIENCPACLEECQRPANQARFIVTPEALKVHLDRVSHWIPCPDCGELYCTLHNQHLADCPCPPI